MLIACAGVLARVCVAWQNMFNGAAAFVQDLSKWVVSKVTTMEVRASLPS